MNVMTFSAANAAATSPVPAGLARTIRTAVRALLAFLECGQAVLSRLIERHRIIDVAGRG